MKKKVLIALLALTVAVSAMGCGSKKSDSEDSTKAKTESSSEEEKTAEEVETDSDGHVVAVDTDDITKYVTLGDYKNLSVKVPKTEVTDDSISEYINEQLTYKPEEITEDRAVQENDTVNIDYTGYMDGKEFSGGSATDTDLLIGSGQFIDGFESGLIGAKKGDEVTLNLKFPDPYQNNPDFSGKDVDQFFKDLKKIDIKKAVYISDSRIPENQKILGNHNGRWFLAYNSMLDKNVIEQEITESISKIKNKNFMVDESEEHKIIRKQPEFKIKYKMDMNKFFRFCAKVAFNVSTHLNGKEFMLNECFDEIREAIISGENINNYVHLCPENLTKTFGRIHYTDKYGEHIHSVICFQIEEEYCAMVNFYGFTTCILVKLTNCLKVYPMTEPNGFFCDWENGKEYNMLNFIEGLA